MLFKERYLYKESLRLWKISNNVIVAKIEERSFVKYDDNQNSFLPRIISNSYFILIKEEINFTHLLYFYQIRLILYFNVFALKHVKNKDEIRSNGIRYEVLSILTDIKHQQFSQAHV